MKARHLIFFLLLLACFLLPSHAGQAEEGGKTCPKPLLRGVFPPAGKPGDLVYIRGVRFSLPRGEVFFAAGVYTPLDLIAPPKAKAEIVRWTFHHITVIVPKSAASGPLFIRVHCGEESNKLTFTLNK